MPGQKGSESDSNYRGYNGPNRRFSVDRWKFGRAGCRINDFRRSAMLGPEGFTARAVRKR
jgi:hypothetical protein